MQIVRYAGLCARNIKRKFAEIARTALEALRLQAPLFELTSLPTTLQHLKWRERIKKSFGYDPLQCPRCGRTLDFVVSSAERTRRNLGTQTRSHLDEALA